MSGDMTSSSLPGHNEPGRFQREKLANAKPEEKTQLVIEGTEEG